MIFALLAPIALAAPPGYVEPITCRPCHQETYDRYVQTPMGRSFHLTGSKSDIADWNNASFHHKASDQYFEMFRRAGDQFVRRYRLEQGRRVDMLERRVTHIMGSGERAISYLHQTQEGRLFELPVSWYSQEKAWGMSPGYDRPNHAGFTRQVNHKCMFCHNAYPDVPPEKARTGWDADVLFPQKLPLGIDCQRCHGPGAAHSASRKPADIVNPAKLGPERSLEVCMQCHYETTTFPLPDSIRRFGRSFYSYLPGEPLGDYIVHFDHAPGTGHEGKFEIVSAAYRLRQSRCFQKSDGRMTCLNCHNPHRETGTVAERCSGCHAAVTGHPQPDRRDCAACHMPKRRTEDVVHVAMTDHKIARRPPGGNLLLPRSEKVDISPVYRGEVVQVYPPAPAGTIYRAVAQVKEKASLLPGIRMLEEALKNQPSRAPEPWFELAEALRTAGRDQDAEAAYRRAVTADPAYAQAWNNLGNLLARAGRRQEAADAYQRALAVTPWDSTVHVNLGLNAIEYGPAAGGYRIFEAAVQADPSSADARANLGAMLLLLGRKQDARRQLETALALDPNHAKARANLAIALRD